MKSLHKMALILAGALTAPAVQAYTPSESNLSARKEFADSKFGIFLHWGLYSMFAQGEWYLNHDINAEEYSKAASAFYPSRFDADQWVRAIKDSGARYITFTSRHHDGFSMWHTAQSSYNIVDATPWQRDILSELSDACRRNDMRLHLYYSHIDWGRADYPVGRTGLNTGVDHSKPDWPGYYDFMNRQLTELLTDYQPINAIWFDGMWDHDSDSVPFDWQLSEQYGLIHRLSPSCLIGNNHHLTPFEGEDIQIFERDLPGQNTTGWADEQTVSQLPLETCQTMNGMWGYKVIDQNYKSTRELIHLLVKTSGMGANLLLNIGPQPNGELPKTAMDRLREIGLWLRTHGESIYGTTAGDFAEQPWGTSTRKGNKLYVHILDSTVTALTVPINCKAIKARHLVSGTQVKFKQTRQGVVFDRLAAPAKDEYDRVIELVTSKI